MNVCSEWTALYSYSDWKYARTVQTWHCTRTCIESARTILYTKALSVLGLYRSVLALGSKVYSDYTEVFRECARTIQKCARTWIESVLGLYRSVLALGSKVCSDYAEVCSHLIESVFGLSNIQFEISMFVTKCVKPHDCFKNIKYNRHVFPLRSHFQRTENFSRSRTASETWDIVRVHIVRAHFFFEI